MLGPDRRIVESSRNRMRQLDIAIVILQNVGAGTLQHAGTATGKAGGMAAARDRPPARLDTDQPNGAVADERVEDAQRITAAADARDNGVGETAGQLEDLAAGLAPD